MSDKTDMDRAREWLSDKWPHRGRRYAQLERLILLLEEVREDEREKTLENAAMEEHW